MDQDLPGPCECHQKCHPIGGPGLARRSSTESGATLLDGPDPLLRVQPKVAVGDHAGGLLEGGVGLGDQIRGSSGGSA
jgi:hypothetical protein